MSIAQDILGGGNSRPIRAVFGKTKFTMFFDRLEVTRRFDRKESRVLGGTGAFARSFMRRSIRKAGKKYDPKNHRFEPPRYHERGFASLKDGIFFFAELETSSVIIGPNKLTGTNTVHNKASGAQLQEEGGRGRVRVFRANKPRTFKQRTTARTRTGRRSRKIVKSEIFRPGRWESVRARWQRRPYVQPTERPARQKMTELIARIPA